MTVQRLSLWMLLAYQAVFLNILLPGHTRGQITLDGKHSVASHPACCCDQNLPAVPSRKDRDQCALCQFMSVLTSVPIIQFKLTELGLLESTPIPPPLTIESLGFIPTYFACGPPVLSPEKV